MPSAFLFMNISTGGEEEILDKLKVIEGVSEQYAVYGVYDIVVKVEGDTMGKVREIIQKDLRNLGKVESTLTMLIAD